MTFAKNSDLPKGVKTLPAEAQTVFRVAFNASGKDGAPGFRVGWAAVFDAGFQQDGEGAWVKFDNAPYEEEEEENGKKKKKPAAGDAAPESVNVHEVIALDANAKVHMTKEGYLVANPRVARSGIQVYKGFELGMADKDEIKLLRPESEVFSHDSMRSYAHRPVTNDHPPELVDAKNWDKYSVGSTGDEVMRDGTFVRVPMVLMDAAAIADVKSGKRQLSNGYTMDVKWTAGKTESGESYDGIQTAIRSNHIAVVEAARGGPKLAIGDQADNPGVDVMTVKDENGLKTITIDGLPVAVSDMGASVITRYIDRLQKKVQDAEASKDTAIASAQGVIESKDATIATLEKKLADAEITPKRLDDMVRERSSIIRKARVLVGDRLSTEGKTLDEIMRQVVDKQMGNVARDWKPEQIRTSFDSLTIAIKDTAPARSNALDDVLRDGVHNAADAREAAYGGYVNDLENAWKRPQHSQQDR